ncbi:MAG: LuxR C-terminal-related transcriptional regulator [Lachnospiraceae bacterium]|nr:LuxR C-terminal-related transcriptional regulator [Lachnospiraceae bacterium]
MGLDFIRITEADLAFGKNEVRDYFDLLGITADEEDIDQVTGTSEGYPIALFYYARHMQHGERYSDDLQEAVWQDLFHMWDDVVYGQWNEDFREFALAMCGYDDFNVEMTQKVTGNPSAGKVIEYCRRNTNQLIYKNDGYYMLRPEMRRYFEWKKSLLWTQQDKKENYRRGARYFEEKGEVTKALKYYKLAGETEHIRSILMREAALRPGVGSLVEMKDYYFEMSETEIMQEPLLMAGMSMLCSIILKKELSKLWYERLSDYEKDRNNSRESRSKAAFWLAYLNIALPHKGTKGLQKTLKDTFEYAKKENVKLPELSVTGNSPSIMNGGLDLCDWVKNDTQMEKLVKAPVEAITGRFGKGLVTTVAAESGFEKGSMRSRDVLSRCAQGYSEAIRGGSCEIAFASMGVQARQYIMDGDRPMAVEIYTSFKKYAADSGASWLMPEIEAFGMYLSLYTGNASASGFVAGTHDARSAFCTLDRYVQMMRLKALIAVGELEKAADLSFFLDGYFMEYDRKYYHIQNEVLRAVIFYRLGDPLWKEYLIDALKLAEPYHFIRVISLEGEAVLPLLNELTQLAQIQDINWEFLSQVLAEANQMALYYPDYLRMIPKNMIKLTKRESQILSMLCSGLTSEDICTKCEITYACLKKHNRSIYAKLGASNRAEAERKAVQIGLVYRGR